MAEDATNVVNDADTLYEEESYHSRLVKKAKWGRSEGQGLKGEGGVPRKRKRGRLRFVIEEMPLEIVLEICSHLGPRDLLHLVRSAKVFARHLLRPGVAGVWKAAREECAPDMPPIHPDLTEQKYALLGFGSNCQNCGTFTSSATNWYLRKRWCRKCRRDVLRSEYYDMCLSFDLSKYTRADQKYDVILHQARIPRYEGYFGRRRVSICVCPDSEAKAFKLKAEGLTDEEWEEYVSEGKEKKQALDAHAKLCTEWTENRISGRQDELRTLRCEREAAVKSRLVNMGFATVFIDPAIRFGFPGLRVSKHLTDKEWVGMKQCAIGAVKRREESYLEEFLRRARESKGRIISRYWTWYECRDPGNEFWPLPSDVWMIPAIEVRPVYCVDLVLTFYAFKGFAG
ncbi:uncharacterized protein EI90DRAFT_1880135 [Cantharellus anzutake]|uniref:uncharacterized protein n=1 Tax=Cantharellus anzutake TaxID=1750568 RepID=UPI0019044CFB|nr:uncharacterized protein EI90DRAFT_1880135 [Cantharellus anzutake]KAF8326853.1 hypothetical protein EI90DRAFT_1880135 [Cantharellus anzutake]